MGSPLVEEALLALARRREAEAEYRDISLSLDKHICGLCLHFCTGRTFLLTFDGDLGIGGGPPGLRVWLDGSLTLSKCIHAALQKKYHT